MPRWAQWPLTDSENFFAELLAAFGIGQGFEELRPAETLHLAENFLEPAPISNRVFKPLILFLGQGDANGLPFDFAGPRITSAPGSWSPGLNIAFANPPGVGQLRPKPGVFLLAGRRG